MFKTIGAIRQGRSDGYARAVSRRSANGAGLLIGFPILAAIIAGVLQLISG